MRAAWPTMTRADRAEKVLQLYRDGKTYREMMEALGAPSRNSIAGVLNRLRAAGKLNDTRRTTEKAKPKPKKARTSSHAKASVEACEVARHDGRAEALADAPDGVELASRLDAGRTASATSERMDVTVVGDESGTLILPTITPVSSPVALLDLTSTTCRWPVDGDGAETLFCGAHCEPTDPYCPNHSRVACQPRKENRHAARP